MTTLSGKTIIMSGGSRGIGLAIAVRAARDGANITLIAKTDKADPRLVGTIHTAAEAIEAAGGQALPVVGDVRDDETLASAVEQTAAAVRRDRHRRQQRERAQPQPHRARSTRSATTSCRTSTSAGTFMLTKAALPHLLASPGPQGPDPLARPSTWTRAGSPATRHTRWRSMG